jgi:hypothetical protein
VAEVEQPAPEGRVDLAQVAAEEAGGEMRRSLLRLKIRI